MKWTAKTFNEQDSFSGDITIYALTQGEAQTISDQYSELYLGYYAILNTGQDDKQSDKPLVKRIVDSFAGRA